VGSIVMTMGQAFAMRPPRVTAGPTIQVFGDSTMDSELGAYPYWLARWGARVTNRAVGGTNSVELRNGTDGLNAAWPGSVSADYVVINHGLRDGYVGFPAAFTPLEDYIENLEYFADNPGGATVIFQTPNPSTDLGRDMAPYAEAMRDVAAAKGCALIDVYTQFMLQPNWHARIPDGTHPDAQALRYIVNLCAAPIIDALV
jgi:hypothetical protein